MISNNYLLIPKHHYKNKIHKIMARIIELDPKIPLGGAISDYDYLKSAFTLIISVAGNDGVSPLEIEQIKHKITSNAMMHFNAVEKQNIQKLLNYCLNYIDDINKGRYTREDIMRDLPRQAEDYLFHLHRLNIPGKRILMLLYTAIIVSWSDGDFSSEERIAVTEATKLLKIKPSELNNLIRLARIDLTLKNTSLKDNIGASYNAKVDLDKFYDEIFSN